MGSGGFGFRFRSGSSNSVFSSFMNCGVSDALRFAEECEYWLLEILMVFILCLER